MSSWIAQLLDFARDGDTFSAPQPTDGPGRSLFGGLIAAQALGAAGRTVEPDKLPQSLHLYFVRGGQYGIDVEFHVERTRDGRSFDTRRVTAKQNGKTILELTLKPGQKSTSTRLKMWVDPAKALISQVEYYDATGKKTRTQIRDDYRADSPKHMSPFLLRFIDHVRNNHETELRLQKSQLDTGLGDDVFTVRALSKG